MKYLVVAVNKDGKLEWNIVESKRQLATFITINYKWLVEKVEYDSVKLHQYLQIFEIEPNYDILAFGIIKPVDFKITIC